MDHLWIKSSGTADEAAAAELIGNAAGDTYLAYFTDGFCAGRVSGLPSILPRLNTLLELRVFDKTQELWLHRSAVGSVFHWRIADDDTLRVNAARQTEPYLQEPENYRITHTQILDIDDTYPGKDCCKTDAAGNLLLRTTVGGCYALPIADSQRNLCLVSYLHYDENGVATAADYRMAGFSDREEGPWNA